MARSRVVVGCSALIGLAALAACSSAPAPSPAPPATSAASAAPDVAAADGNLATCAALPPFDAVIFTYPGADPDAPAPSADAVKQWAATATGPLDTLAAGAPAELDPSVAKIRSAVEGAGQGTPVTVDDPALSDAVTALDKWGYDNCGWPTLDITGSGTELSGVPATLPAGPLAVSFDNGGAPEQRGFVLLVARVHDGAAYTVDGIRDGSVEFTSVADVVGAAQPTPQSPTAYSVATLTPGTYLVVSPIGSPPQFSKTLAEQFTVS